MNESFAFLIIIMLLIAFIAYRDYMGGIERKQLIRAIMAKNLTEVVQSEALEKSEPTQEKPPDLVPAETLDQAGFDKMIAQQIKRGGK